MAVASARNSRRAAAFASAVPSRNTSTTPRIVPDSSRMGAPLSWMGVSVPSRETSSVWFASPTTTPSRSTRSTGLSTVLRVCSLMMWKIARSGCPWASASFQPVSRSATGFMSVTSPRSSVATTASPMLWSVVCSDACASSAAWRAAISRSSISAVTRFASASCAGRTRSSSARLRSVRSRVTFA
jgi:hypothetical protein